MELRERLTERIARLDFELAHWDLPDSDQVHRRAEISLIEQRLRAMADYENDPRMFMQQPKSRASGVRRLWDWYTAQTGEEPYSIFVIRPGKVQRQAGAARWELEGYDRKIYYVFDLENALKSSLSEAIPAPGLSRGYYLNE